MNNDVPCTNVINRYSLDCAGITGCTNGTGSTCECSTAVGYIDDGKGGCQCNSGGGFTDGGPNGC